MKTKGLLIITLAVLCLVVGSMGEGCVAQEDLPYYLKDRGTGVPTSMFATYARQGELLVYPFFEYYLDDDMEYSPSELGFGLDQDFRGRYRASEGLMFVGYGVTDRVAVELEVAVIEASLEKSADDTTSVPPKLTESGLGDVQTQVNWRWLEENDHRPEAFSYAEVVFPHHKDKVLIGTSDWEIKVGIGVIRGFRWGTLIGRAAVEYSRAEEKAELGEVAIEYVKRVSSLWRFYVGVEAAQDEVELIAEAQVHLGQHAFVKLNNGLGLTSKATDWAPEIGVMFSLPTR